MIRNPADGVPLDVIVLGGGPAGVVVAKKLAAYGHHVALIARPRRYFALEGLSERAIAGLRFSGCQQALLRLGPPVRRVAHWNGERVAANREWLVERGPFDTALRKDARQAGVYLIDGRAMTSRPCADGWAVQYNPTPGKPQALSSRFVIDARGREAPHGRGVLRRGPVTIALSRVWAAPATAKPNAEVASFADGWAWFAVNETGIGVLQIFVSAERDRLPPRSRLEAYYNRLQDVIGQTGAWLVGAHPRSGVYARYAHPQFNRKLFSENYVRVGDAAFAIDPLSGHGVYEAVGSALALAAALNTCLKKPEDMELALRFYRERMEADFLRMSRIGRDFYRGEQRWPDRAYWCERSSWPDGEPAHVPPASSPPRVERRPVNANGLISLREVIVTADHPRGIWQVAGVDLVPLLQDMKARHGQTPEECSHSCAMRDNGNPQSYRTALAWLMHRGLVESNGY